LNTIFFHLFAFSSFFNIPNAPLIKVALVSTFKTDFPTSPVLGPCLVVVVALVTSFSFA
jgi:hypothetical protein